MYTPSDVLSRSPSGVISILFVHDLVSSAAGRTERHAHEFWQMEIGVFGAVDVWDAGSTWKLHPGTALLLAPGRMHAFTYPDVTVRWVTFKFEAPDLHHRNSSWRIDDGHPLAPVLPSLITLAPAVDRGRAVERVTVASLLDAVTTYSTGTDTGGAPVAASPSTFVTKIDNILRDAGGQSVAIADLADSLNLTPGHVSNRFRTEVGRSLKRYIDETRCVYIVKLLTYSDLPIKLIAHQTGFPDVYAFSRFVKRISGAPPREFRRDRHLRERILHQMHEN